MKSDLTCYDMMKYLGDFQKAVKTIEDGLQNNTEIPHEFKIGKKTLTDSDMLSTLYLFRYGYFIVSICVIFYMFIIHEVMTSVYVINIISFRNIASLIACMLLAVMFGASTSLILTIYYAFKVGDTAFYKSLAERYSVYMKEHE